MAFLWRDVQRDQRNGSFLKLAPMAQVEMRGNEAWLHAVVIQGETEVQRQGEAHPSRMTVGSYFAAKNGLANKVTCESDAACLIYVSTRGKYTVTQR